MVSCRDIRSHLDQLGFLEGKPGVADGDSLMDAGILNSLRLMELVPELERRFRFRVPVRDLLPANFDSIQSIARYVEACLPANEDVPNG